MTKAKTFDDLKGYVEESKLEEIMENIRDASKIQGIEISPEVFQELYNTDLKDYINNMLNTLDDGKRPVSQILNDLPKNIAAGIDLRNIEIDGDTVSAFMNYSEEERAQLNAFLTSIGKKSGEFALKAGKAVGKRTLREGENLARRGVSTVIKKSVIDVAEGLFRNPVARGQLPPMPGMGC